MKYLNKIILIIFLILPASCNKEKNDVTSLDIKLSKTRILGDGLDNLFISVFDQNNNDITTAASVYINGKLSVGRSFKSTLAGIYKINASYNTIESDTVLFEVVSAAGLKFQKSVLLEQYTGTWCGYCPRAIANIENIQLTENNIVHIAYHISSQSSPDVMAYSQNLSLFQSFGFTGVPTVHADRKYKWEGESNIISNLKIASGAGLSLEVSGNPTSVSARIKAKFGYSFDDGLKLSMFLVHDSLVANQTNYYNTDPTSKFYQKGDIMTGFVHRNAMIKPGLDMFGEAIPSDSIGIGSTFTRLVTFTNFRCDDIKHVKIVALITYSEGGKKGQVVNSIIARVGEKKGFAVVVK